MRRWRVNGIVYLGVGGSAWLLLKSQWMPALPFRALALSLLGAGLLALLLHGHCLWEMTGRTVEWGALLSGLLCFGLGGLLSGLTMGAGPGAALGLFGAALLLCHACLSARVVQQVQGGLLDVVQFCLAAYWAVSVSILFA